MGISGISYGSFKREMFLGCFAWRVCPLFREFTLKLVHADVSIDKCDCTLGTYTSIYIGEDLGCGEVVSEVSICESLFNKQSKPGAVER